MAENSDIGTAVGTFDTIDVDVGQTDNYRLINSANGMFRITANVLEVSFFWSPLCYLLLCETYSCQKDGGCPHLVIWMTQFF